MSKGGTAGEQLLGRRLKRERRAGTWHYVTGQHAAQLDEETSEPGLPVYALSYVDVTGHAVVAYCARAEEAWLPVAVLRAGQASVSGVRSFPADFELSPAMLAVLDEAAGS